MSEVGERGLGVVGNCEVGDGEEAVVVVGKTAKLLRSSEAARCWSSGSQDTMACAVPPHAPEMLRSPPPAPDLYAFVRA